MPHQSNLDMAWLHSNVVLIHRKQHNYQLDNMNIKLPYKTEVSNPWKTTNRWSSHPCNLLSPQKSQKRRTAMYKPCKHEMSNWSKWFRENPQTSHPSTIACMYNSSNKAQNEPSRFNESKHKTKLKNCLFRLCFFSCAKLAKDTACSFQFRTVTKHLYSLVWCLKHKTHRKWYVTVH